MRILHRITHGCCLCLTSLLVGTCTVTCWSQEAQLPSSPSELLVLGVRQAGSVRAGFRIVVSQPLGDPWPLFKPIKGLDQSDVVPFLIDVLENGPNWTDRTLLEAREGMYPHIARCYAAMCLGCIGDQRAFAPLVRALQKGDFLESKLTITSSEKERYHISDYAALALGYLGNPDAVQPLLSALQKDSRTSAIFGLTKLRDPRAIRPIIEYTSARDRLDFHTHRCLEYIARVSFRMEYSSRTRKSSIPAFPELGEFEPDKAPKALWPYWLKKGDKFAKQQFDEHYPVWRRAWEEKSQYPEGEEPYGGIMFRMLQGGIAALPYVMDELEKGDESLLYAVDSIKLGKKYMIINSHHLSADVSTRDKALKWWQDNKQKWLVVDPNGP
jgi:hypothetical protein